MTAIDGIDADTLMLARIGAANGRDPLLLIATVGAWRTLGELDKLVGSAEFDQLRPADYPAWLTVRGAIADEMRRLCELLAILDPEHTLRRPQITDGPTAPVGSPPAAHPAAQPAAPFALAAQEAGRS